MQIRPATSADLSQLREIDATIESEQYLHINTGGEGVESAFRLECRPLRQKRVDNNLVGDELRFTLKQIVQGIEDGLVLIAELDEQPVGLAVAQPDPAHDVLRLIDLRIDYDLRRQGLGSGLLYAVIAEARQQKRRAVLVETRSDNHPAAHFLAKSLFELSGLDTRRFSNHDLVKEAATLTWYLPLD